MIIDFTSLKEVIIPNLNGGEGSVSAKMFMQPQNKIIFSRLKPGSSIGPHQHNTSSGMNYVISGNGKAFCNYNEEILKPGICHYCEKGQSHSIINNGTEELIMFTFVCEQ